MNKDELKQYRERIGLTQGELSKALGVANNTVSRWELGERSIPVFLPLALETIERRLSGSTVGSESVSTVGSNENKADSTVGKSAWDAVKAAKKAVESNSPEVFKHSVLDIVQSSSDNELLSTHQVAERLGVSRKSVNDYIIQGKLPAVKGKQGHNFISIDDVLIFEAVYKEKS